MTNNDYRYFKIIVDVFFDRNNGYNNFLHFIHTPFFNINELYRILEDNQIIFRFLSILQSDSILNSTTLPENVLNLKTPKLESQLAFIRHLNEVNDIFYINSINVIYLKIDKFPDFGKDFDTYVGFDYKKAVRSLKDNGWSQKRTLLKIFNRPPLSKYKEKIWTVDLYSKISRFNENWFFDSNSLISKKRKFLINGIKINILSPENSLLYECISSTYFNGYINLGGMIYAKKQIDDENFNVTTIISDIKNSNCELGAYIFLTLYNKINPSTNISTILNSISCSNYLKKFLCIALNNFMFPFYIPIHIQWYLYFDKFIRDVKKKKDFKSIFLIFPLYANLRNEIFRFRRRK